MKRFSLATPLLALLLVSGGCDRNLTVPHQQGELRGVLDGATWQGTATGELHRDTLIIWSTRRGMNAEHTLSITAVQSGSGTYTIVTEGMSSSAASAYWETVGGDVVVYHASATSGTIHFTKLDRAAGTARGTVELTLEGPRGTSRFEMGEFDVKGPPRVLF